jgi:hypothetical protein
MRVTYELSYPQGSCPVALAVFEFGGRRTLEHVDNARLRVGL